MFHFVFQLVSLLDSSLLEDYHIDLGHSGTPTRAAEGKHKHCKRTDHGHNKKGKGKGSKHDKDEASSKADRVCFQDFVM